MPSNTSRSKAPNRKVRISGSSSPGSEGGDGVSRFPIKTTQEDSACATTGEVFDHGGMIELVRDPNSGRLLLFHADGAATSIAPCVERNGKDYEPAAIDSTILRAMALPTKCVPCGPVPHLLDDLARPLTLHAALGERLVRIVGRFVLSSWVLDGLLVAPSLRIVGPETLAGVQLLQLLHGFCRHAIRLTAANVAGICSLPQWQFTLLIRQPELDPSLQRLLRAARRPGEFIPRGKRLLDLHAAVVSYTEFGADHHDPRSTSFEIHLPSHQPVEILRADTMARMAEEFQDRLLGYRREILPKVCDSTFDVPQFRSPMCDLARSLGACTPGDAELQAEVVTLLQEMDAELRSGRWTDPTVTLLEALLGFDHEGQREVYCIEMAKAVMAILRARGEPREVEPRAVGSELREHLELNVEKRDARGMRLILSEAVRRRVHELARNYDAPSVDKGMVVCPYCKAPVLDHGQER